MSSNTIDWKGMLTRADLRTTALANVLCRPSLRDSRRKTSWTLMQTSRKLLGGTMDWRVSALPRTSSRHRPSRQWRSRPILWTNSWTFSPRPVCLSLPRRLVRRLQVLRRPRPRPSHHHQRRHLPPLPLQRPVAHKMTYWACSRFDALFPIWIIRSGCL